MVTDLREQLIPYGEQILIGSSDTILSSIYRSILLELQLDYSRFMALLERYVVSSGLAKNTSEISTMRSSMRADLMAYTMTWRVFVTKGLMFLRPRGVLMRFSLEFRSGQRSEHDLMFEVQKESAAISESEDGTDTLALFYRSILVDLGIDRDRLYEHMTVYIKKLNPNISAKALSAERSALRRELMKSTMTWRVLIKGLQAIDVSVITLKTRVYHAAGWVSEHTKTIRLEDAL